MESRITSIIFRLSIVALSGLFIIVFIILSWKYLHPFIIAFFISWLLRPYIHIVEKFSKMPRSMAILTVMLIFGSLTFSLITLAITELFKGILYLSKLLPSYLNQFIHSILNLGEEMLTPLIMKGEKFLHGLTNQQQHSLMDSFTVMKEKLSIAGGELLAKFFEWVTTLLSMLPSSVTFFLICSLATFFFCKDWEWIMKMLRKWTPAWSFQTIKDIPVQLKKTLLGLLKAQAILVLISTCSIAVGLHLLDVPHAWTITLFAAIVDIIPYIGTGIIFIPWIIYQFFNGAYDLTIGLSIIYMVVVVTRQLLEPKLLAVHFGVPPIILLICLFAGYQFFGFYGFFLSPIFIMFVKVLHTTGVWTSLRSYILGK
ncbi:sporulation integral membrane protein YtvI [Halobacillus yeomjeoni]|uniref:Sporulation integral membrane protein YtvI n=1 Tax=Halobacillus yeomjeoni TaxID=311194 RepID=A0A931MV21_9BACI|nr:sporulation integral membrane protein YtvI [Halobacillus yeomjeoni]MBH0230130.1 sporulation integral membrane protein YtvI [Halobacillus yeomjeoni]